MGAGRAEAPVIGPTQTLNESDTWAPRRGFARAVGFAIRVLPFICAMLASFVLGRLLPRPIENWVIAWWLTLVGGAQITLRLVERVMQRFVPLSTLLDVSAVFPDHAPSRFSMALRMGNVHKANKAARLAVDEGLPVKLDEALAVALAMVNLLGDHDRGTRGHSERVRAYSELLGEELGLDRHARQRLKWGAMLHDIGKLAVPAEILNKAGKPDAAEWEILQTHPGHATRILAPLEDWLGDAFHAADQHHERWDGRGYPNGLAGEEIALSARIVAVADAFTVMTTARAYKKPMSIELARRELTRGAGTQFDPAVVRAMLSLSIGRVTLTAGPAAALVNIPFLGSLAAGASAVPAAVATGAVAAGVTAIAAVVPLAVVPVVTGAFAHAEALEWTASVPWGSGIVDEPIRFETPSRLAFAVETDPTTLADDSMITFATMVRQITSAPLRTPHHPSSTDLLWEVGDRSLLVTNDLAAAGPAPADSDAIATARLALPAPTSTAARSAPTSGPVHADEVPMRTSVGTVVRPAAAATTTSTTISAPTTTTTSTSGPVATTTIPDTATTSTPPTTSGASTTSPAGSTTLAPTTTAVVATTIVTAPAPTTEAPTTVVPTTAAPTTLPGNCGGAGRGKAKGNPHCP